MTEETIFLTALEQATPAKRAAFLAAACAGDAALRQRVEALLRSHADPDSFLDMPAIERQAEGTDGPKRTTDLPAGTTKGASPKRREAGRDMRDEVLALLAPGGDPASLGRLDYFEVLEVVGCGGMGVVFKARDTKLQRVVAIKVLVPLLAANGTARKRFVREAQAAAAVRDNHVVDIHGVQDDGSVPYLVMEFIGGVTLEQRMERREPMEVKEILRIGMQAAEGLAAAHRQGLIHRDVKPANILLENGVQHVKITDFGLARAGDDASLTQTGVIAGTPMYMSPEQTRGETLDQRSDLFSLGSVLYLLCTGREAFAAGNTMAVLKRVCEETPRAIREINPEIPQWLAAVVGRLMAKDVSERFQTAEELAEVLRRQLAELQQSGTTPAAPPERPANLPPATGEGEPGDQKARKRKRLLVAAVLVAGVAASLAIVVALSRRSSPSPAVTHPGPPDPRVLTVSKNPSDRAGFDTINAALDVVKPGMTVRVLDDAVYEEHLRITAIHCQVVLEAVGKAILRKPPDSSTTVDICNVANLTLRGFHFHSAPGRFAQVYITGDCPGVVLDRLDITTNESSNCIDLNDQARGRANAPIVIQNCIMRGRSGGGLGVVIEGCDRTDNDRPLTSGHIWIYENVILGCGQGIALLGDVRHVHVVGNRILGNRIAAIDLVDFLPGATEILVANNSILRCQSALRIWDDHDKGQAFLKCKSIRIQNNLVFQTHFAADFLFSNHRRGTYKSIGPGDLQSLLTSQDWRFSHNWREVDPIGAKARVPDRWIPPSATDHVPSSAIKVLSQEPDDPNFLRPPKDSPLATGGAGTSDISLPAYVGAVPPEGVEPWDWQKTWDIQCRRLLTVSKEPAAGGHFRTIQEALDKVQPEMTIRVLDDAVYAECLLITARHSRVTLEAASHATLHKLPDKDVIAWIRGVPGFTLRGFRFTSSPGNHVQLYITGSCPGAILDHLDMKATNEDGTCVQLRDVRLAEKDAPIVIRNCIMRDSRHAVLVSGQARENWDHAVPAGHVAIRDNTMVNCNAAVALTGASYRVNVVGNRILGSEWAAIDFEDFLPGAVDILLANNTLFRNHTAVRVWDDHRKGKEFLKCKNIRLQNNLVLDPLYEPDMVLLNHTRGRGGHDAVGPGDVNALLENREWRFGHNWREIDPVRAARDPSWIRGPTDNQQVPISGLSRTRDDPNFLRPPKDSPLAWSGAGGHTLPAAHVAAALAQAAGPVHPWAAAWSLAQTMHQPDRALPAYVGAVPPEGVAAWDWDKTWKMMNRR
jgi:serine/threonine protein kinase